MAINFRVRSAPLELAALHVGMKEGKKNGHSFAIGMIEELLPSSPYKQQDFPSSQPRCRESQLLQPTPLDLNYAYCRGGPPSYKLS